MKSAVPTFDPRSAAPTLFYRGPAVVSGVPARDLSDADLARLAFVAAEVRPATVLDVPAKDIAAIRDRLVESGIYSVKGADHE